MPRPQALRPGPHAAAPAGHIAATAPAGRAAPSRIPGIVVLPAARARSAGGHRPWRTETGGAKNVVLDRKGEHIGGTFMSEETHIHGRDRLGVDEEDAQLHVAGAAREITEHPLGKLAHRPGSTGSSDCSSATNT